MLEHVIDRSSIYKKGRHAMLTCLMCKLSRCNLIKLEAIQARHHMQHARKYHTTKLKKAPGMLE